MRNKLLASVVAFICCISLVSLLVVSSADGIDYTDVLEDTAYSLLIGSSDLADSTNQDIKYGLKGLASDVTENILSNAFVNATKDNGGLLFSIPSYDIVTGKYMLHWVLQDGSQDDILVECTIIVSDNPSYLTTLKPIKERAYGDIYYYANCLNYSITRTDGTIKRYVVSLPTGFDYSKFSFNSESLATGNLSGCTIYEYKGGSDLSKSRPIRTAAYINAVNFNTSSTNSIRVDLQNVASGSSSVQQYPVGFYSNVTGTVGPNNYVGYPVDIDIVTGSFVAKYRQLSNPNAYNGTVCYCNRLFKCGFATTNNPDKGRVLNKYWTTPSTQNYYYNDYIQGGTTINESNVNNYFNGAFLPAFDIDPDLPLADILNLLADLLPDFKTNIQPTLKLSVDDLFDRLFDFYSKMPEIDMQWDPSIDNDNYWDLQLPAVPDSGGGGGDITVNVDITRPKIPYIDTNPQITLYVPTVTTTALPPSVISSGKNFVDWGKEITDMTGTTSIIITCGLVGVGVMLIFKDW